MSGPWLKVEVECPLFKITRLNARYAGAKRTLFQIAYNSRF